MAEELTDIMQKFALSSKEIGGTKLDISDVDEGILECQESIIGRVKGEKIVNFTGVKNFITIVWSYPKNLK